jgi:aspartyl-tRNA(Asn)/glutamyl-tRNA(Gln) amidotransferase subunit A
MALCWTLDKLGPMTRSAADAENVLRAIAGADPKEPTAVDAPFRRARRRPRIAVLAKSTHKTMPAVKANFERSLEVLAEFCDIAGEVELPDFPYGAAVSTIIDAEGAAAFRGFIESGRMRQLRNAKDRIGGYAMHATLAIDYIDALRHRSKMRAALEAAFGAYDAVATTTLPTVAYPVGVPFEKADQRYRGSLDTIAAGNLAGVPAIGIPNGLGPNGLPTGLSLLGRPFCEEKLTAIARAYQARTTFHTQRPVVRAASVAD